MVIAIIRPDLNLFLVESMERRSAWLHDIVDAIGLDNVEIYHGRAERLSHVIQADIVTARAVASVRRLLPYYASFEIIWIFAYFERFTC